jgi:hypothetical protein
MESLEASNKNTNDCQKYRVKNRGEGAHISAAQQTKLLTKG